ncbi:MAG: hypothetical protein HS111_35255 [Kofleriaceae bacterium]|nr:hypothetical protein [Kofleriaceae bacterium]
MGRLADVRAGRLTGHRDAQPGAGAEHHPAVGREVDDEVGARLVGRDVAPLTEEHRRAERGVAVRRGEDAPERDPVRAAQLHRADPDPRARAVVGVQLDHGDAAVDREPSPVALLVVEPVRGPDLRSVAGGGVPPATTRGAEPAGAGIEARRRAEFEDGRRARVLAQALDRVGPGERALDHRGEAPGRERDRRSVGPDVERQRRRRLARRLAVTPSPAIPLLDRMPGRG